MLKITSWAVENSLCGKLGHLGRVQCMIFSPFLLFRQFPTFNLGLAHCGSWPFNYYLITPRFYNVNQLSCTYGRNDPYHTVSKTSHVVFVTGNNTYITSIWIPGWCYMYTPVHRGNKKRSMGLMVFGYDLWVLGSMLWILVMGLTFCFMFCAKKIKVKLILINDCI